MQWYRAVRDHSTSYGRKIELIRDNKGNLKKVSIQFSHEGSFNFHLSKAVGKDIKLFTKRKVGDCVAKVSISEEEKESNTCVRLYKRSIAI